jgi:flagellar hook protein FlgE
MGFQSGLSGLNAASKNLDVIGNNVANAQVAGFKGSVTQFAEMYAASLGNGDTTAAGIGSKVQNVSQLFNQGNISPTNNPLDIAVTGRGFFRLNDNGAIAYSRNGQFKLDSQGYIVSPQGLNLTGYGVDNNGSIVNSNPEPIRMNSAALAPQATDQFEATLNLDSRSSVPPVGTFDPTNTQSFNFATSATLYDSLGNAHVFSMYFVRAAAPGTWSAFGTVDGGPVADVNLGAGAGLPATLAFNSSGTLSTAMPINASVVVSTGAQTPLSFTLDFSGTTQYGAISSVGALSQTGYTSGRLVGFDIAQDGVIAGRYSNGQTRTVAQIVLADFVNPQGLSPAGDNVWAETVQSGLPLVGAPGSGTLGNLQSSAVEESNVDLTAELVNLITAQRNYQANAQTIKTQDAVLQTLVNLR